MPGAPSSVEDLVRACVESGSQADWEAFVRVTHRLIAVVALRTARQWGEVSPEVVDDLVQETYLKLCANRCRILRDLDSKGAGSLFGFLKVMTANLVRDYFRSRRAQVHQAGEEAKGLDEVIETLPGGKEGSVANIEREILIKEIEKTLNECLEGPDKVRNRQIFWLHYRHGLSARAIASLPCIPLSAKGVESTLLRLIRLVRNRLAAEEERQPGSEGFCSAEPL